MASCDGDPATSEGCQGVVGWLDQRAWGIELALAALNQTEPPHPLLGLAEAEMARARPPKAESLPVGMEPVGADRWQQRFSVCNGAATVGFDSSGSLVHLLTAAHNLSYANDSHRLGQTVVHVSSATQREAWARHYMTDPAAALEFFKTGDPLGDGRGHMPSVDAMWRRHNADGTSTVLFRQRLAPHVVRDYGGAEQMWQRYDFGGADALQINVTLHAYNKTATRITESWWLRFHPLENRAVRYENMRLEKLRSLVDPLDIVHNGSRTLHGLTERGVVYSREGSSSGFAAGSSSDFAAEFSVGSLDVPVVKVGAGNASLDPSADPLEGLNPAPVPNDRPPRLQDGFAFNMHNNLWATNGIQWYPFVSRDKDWSFRFDMTVP